MEQKRNGILPCFEQIGHIEFIGSVHIIGVSQMLPIHIEVAQGIQTVAVQQHRIPGRHKIKGFAKCKLMIQQLQSIQFIHTIEGVFHQPLIQQEGIHTSRHSAFTFKACTLHFPNAV